MKINDSIGRITAEAPKIPELEGHIKIELFNAETGELEECVEGKNLVTNAVRDIFASNYFGGMNYSKMMPIFKEMFGGILCFQDLLTEDADGYAIPNYHTNEVKGHAGQATYVPETEGVDITRGNPVFSASGYTEHGFRHVWEFGTTQGNGTIKAVGLCHKDTGSYWLMNGNRSFNPYIDSDTIETTGLLSAPLFFNRSTGTSYRLTYAFDSTSLGIETHCYAGVKDGIGFTQVFPCEEDGDTTNRALHQVTMPHRASDFLYLYHEDTNKIDALYSPGGNKLQKSVIDLSTWTVSTTEHTIADTSLYGSDGSGQYGKNSTGNARAISLDQDGYLYWLKSDRKSVYKIKYTTMIADVEAVSDTTLDSHTYCDGIQGVGHFGINIYEGFVVDHDKIRHTYSNDYILGDGGAEMRDVCSNPDGGMVQFFPVKRNYNSGSRIGVRIAKFFLSTIKNLDTPINKNSTQTMTITYTITEVDDES